MRAHEEAAWVALVDGRVTGHVSVGRVEGDLADAFVRGAGRPADRLAIVSVLFVAPSSQGTGVGGRLLDGAVAWARQRGRLPVLDAVPSHGAALAVYRHRGWREIGAARPTWLPADEEPLLLLALDGADGERDVSGPGPPRA